MRQQTAMEIMGFGDDHVPLVKVARKQKFQELPVTFPTKKANGGYIRARSPLMADALVHLDTNPSVVKISAFPIRLTYSVSDRYRVIGTLDHIPMVGVWTVDQQASYFDVIPLAVQKERHWLTTRTAKLKEVFWDEYRATYAILDERALYLEPRMKNLRTMHYHSRQGDEIAVMGVRKALLQAGPTSTIGELGRIASLSAREHLVFDDDGRVAQRRRLEHEDRAFSAVMWLAHQGEVAVDLSRHFSDTTEVRPLRLTVQGSAA